MTASHQSAKASFLLNLVAAFGELLEHSRSDERSVVLKRIHLDGDLVDDDVFDHAIGTNLVCIEHQVNVIADKNEPAHTVDVVGVNRNWFDQFQVRLFDYLSHNPCLSFRRASEGDLTHGNGKRTVSFKPAVNDLSQKANFLRLRFSSIVKVLASSIDLISLGSNSFKAVRVTVAAKADSIVSELKASWSVGASA